MLQKQGFFSTLFLYRTQVNEFSQVALLILIFGCILFLFLDRDYRLG